MAERTQDRCPVCAAPHLETVYDSQTESSLSSLCQILPGGKTVRFCAVCGHLAGNVMTDADRFYESDYRILIDDEDEDQIYDTRDDRIVTRTDHQLAVFLDKIELTPGLEVLDHGCAKAAMARRLLDTEPRLKMHLFDVSRMYERFWDRLVAIDRQAVHATPASWNGRFDLVTSFFAFEHIEAPAKAMADVARLLKPGGRLHMIVPDVSTNAADFIVVDHVNHFTPPSLTRLLTDAGMCALDIDRTSYRGALVVTARKGEPESDTTPVSYSTEIAAVKSLALNLSDFWTAAAKSITRGEPAGGVAAIYGSGFYGAFIHAHLQRPAAVVRFLDRSPWRQGKTLFGVPITAPETLPDDIETVYVGLNPTIAENIIAALPWSGRAGLRIVFLR